MKDFSDHNFKTNIDAYEFSDLFLTKTQADYDSVERDFVNYYKRVKGVCAIYRFGKPSILGISDLDYIVVFDDDFKSAYGVRYDINFFTKESQYLLIHPQNFICESLMKDIFWFHDIPNLQKVWGRDVEVIIPDDATLKRLKVMTWLNTFSGWIPKIFIGALCEQKIYFRGLLSKIKVLKYVDSIIMGESGSQESKYSEFYDRVIFLRKNWFKNKDSFNKQELLDLIIKSIEVSCHSIGQLGDILETDLEFEFLKDVVPDENCGIRYYKNINYFQNNWRPAEAFEETVNHYRETGEYVQKLPMIFYQFLMSGTTVGGKMGEYFKKNIMGSSVVPQRSENSILDKKMQLINRQITFLEKNRIINSLSFNPGCTLDTKQLRGEHRLGRYRYYLGRLFSK